MATIKLVSGAVSSWTAIMTTELNSLASGNAVLGSSAISNASNLDLEIEFSLVCNSSGISTSSTTSPYATIGMYCLNGDGVTYGDGRFSSAATGPFPSNYYAGFVGFPSASSVVCTGTFGIPYLGTRALLPNGTFKPIFYQSCGGTFASSGNTVYYRTTNRSVA